MIYLRLDCTVSRLDYTLSRLDYAVYDMRTQPTDSSVDNPILLAKYISFLLTVEEYFCSIASPFPTNAFIIATRVL